MSSTRHCGRFPWRALAPDVDVWLPMAYWTYREPSSPYRDAFRYATANVELLTRHVGAAPVHVVGGVADLFTPHDVAEFLRAVRTLSPLGWSVYDWATLSAEDRRTLAEGP